MEPTLKWKKRILSNTYHIFSDEIQVGKLKDNAWTQSADGEINGKKYRFKTKGFLKQETKIIDPETKTVIANISYNTWRTKAKIAFDDMTINWKYDNTWNTKWSLYNSEKILMKYHGSTTKGKIECDKENDLLVLTGLFITNYYWEITLAALIAVFIPVWLTVIN